MCWNSLLLIKGVMRGGEKTTDILSVKSRMFTTEIGLLTKCRIFTTDAGLLIKSVRRLEAWVRGKGKRGRGSDWLNIAIYHHGDIIDLLHFFSYASSSTLYPRQ